MMCCATYSCISGKWAFWLTPLHSFSCLQMWQRHYWLKSTKFTIWLALLLRFSTSIILWRWNVNYSYLDYMIRLVYLFFFLNSRAFPFCSLKTIFLQTIKTNVMGTLNMLGLAKRVGARYLLVFLPFDVFFCLNFVVSRWIIKSFR